MMLLFCFIMITKRPEIFDWFLQRTASYLEIERIPDTWLKSYYNVVDGG